MLTLKDYVNWGLTHTKKKPKSRNLFNKDNIVVQYFNLVTNIQPTETGVSFYTVDDYGPSKYGQYWLSIGNASDFRGKTLTFSSPSYGGTVATKISIVNGRTATQNGSNFAKSGDVYFSRITIPDEEFTTEKVCIMLYVYGKSANELIEYNEIMVNEGSEILPYESYNKK